MLLSEDKRRAYDAEMVAAETSMYSEPDPWQGSSSTSGRRASNGGTTGDGGFEAMFHVCAYVNLITPLTMGCSCSSLVC